MHIAAHAATVRWGRMVGVLPVAVQVAVFQVGSDGAFTFLDDDASRVAHG